MCLQLQEHLNGCVGTLQKFHTSILDGSATSSNIWMALILSEDNILLETFCCSRCFGFQKPVRMFLRRWYMGIYFGASTWAFSLDRHLPWQCSKRFRSWMNEFLYKRERTFYIKEHTLTQSEFICTHEWVLEKCVNMKYKMLNMFAKSAVFSYQKCN